MGTAATTLLFAGLFVMVALRKGPPRLVEKVASFVPGMLKTVVIPEGTNQFQIAEKLEALGICPATSFLELAREREILREFGIPGGSAEGFLFPATYRFFTDEDPGVVLRRMLETGRSRHRAASWEQAPEVLGNSLGRLEVIVLASMVERETGVAAERPRIARVFLNRLNDPDGPTRGRLESDPTAPYGCLALVPAPSSCQGAGGKVTPELLRDATNPFNTYRKAGLPPGPIANPGMEAIDAVLHPAEGEELFFVADGSGKHVFSRTFEEHQQAVRRLHGTRPRAVE